MRAFLLALVLLVPSVALAQDPAPTAHDGDAVIHVYGRRQAPSVTLFLPRAHVRFAPVERDHHAVDRIVESVTRAPF